MRDREPRTVTSTFTQLLSSESVQCCFMSTETVRTLRDGEGSPRRPRRLSHSSRALPNCVGLVNGFTPSCLGRRTGGDRDPRRLGKRETVPNATLSPPE